MREDFNKLLVERERIGSREKFHTARHKKVFNSEMGGRESMKMRHKHNWGGKQFNENLSPLIGWLNSKVGKNWDKSYSELRKTFDTRSVINQHIMEHLWQFVERHAFVNDKDKIVVQNRFMGEVAINESHSEFFICPKSGILKKNNRLSHRQRNKLAAKKEVARRATFFRKIDDYTELHLIDGIWFKYKLKDIPEPIITYVRPLSWTTLPEIIRWDKLSLAEKEVIGDKRVKAVDIDRIVNVPEKHLSWYYRNRKEVKYYSSRHTLSSKELKEYGLKNAN